MQPRDELRPEPQTRPGGTTDVAFDTASIAVAERVAGFRRAFNSASRPTAVRVSDDVSAALRAWDLGRGTTVVQLSMRATELRVDRSARHLRLADAERLSIALNVSGTCVTRNHDREEQDNARLRLTDLSAPYGIVQRGRCTAYAVEMDDEQLGLTVDQVRVALPRVASSLLYELFRRHLVDVATSVPALGADARAEVGAATRHLARGLLASVSPRSRDRRAARAETLAERVDDYIRRHLGDPDLTPGRVAEAHHISRRHLYAVLAAQQLTPSERIMSLRLAAARADLLRPGVGVAVAASRWGFRDHSHFTRRFKAAYGMTPSAFVGDSLRRQPPAGGSR